MITKRLDACELNFCSAHVNHVPWREFLTGTRTYIYPELERERATNHHINVCQLGNRPTKFCFRWGTIIGTFCMLSERKRMSISPYGFEMVERPLHSCEMMFLTGSFQPKLVRRFHRTHAPYVLSRVYWMNRNIDLNRLHLATCRLEETFTLE